MLVKALTEITYETAAAGGLTITRSYYHVGDIFDVTVAESVQLIADSEVVAYVGALPAVAPYKTETVRNPNTGTSSSRGLPADAAGVLTNDGNGTLTWGLTIGGGGNTSILTDNGDGTFTHDDGTGVVVTFNGAADIVTSLSYNTVTKMLSYTDELAAVSNVDLSAFAADIYVNAATFNAATGILSLSDTSAGTPVINIDISALRSIVTDNLDKTYTHNDGNGTLVTIDAQADSIAISPAAIDATGAVGTSTLKARQDHRHPEAAPSADPANSLIVGSDGLHWSPDRIVSFAGVLTGTAPTGAQWGMNTLTGDMFYVNGSGAWTPIVLAGPDLNYTVSDQPAGTMGAAPVAPPATPDTGDVHMENYSDGMRWFSWAGSSWTIISSFSGGANGATVISPAAINAVGTVGTSGLFARQDHRHPGQAVSTDFGNLLSLGTDALPLYSGHAHVFLMDSMVAPAVTGNPTVAEVAAIPMTKNNFITYNGTNSPANTPTHVFFMDILGAVTLIKGPTPTGATLDYAIYGWSASQPINAQPRVVHTAPTTSNIVDNGNNTWTISGGKFLIDLNIAIVLAAGPGPLYITVDGVQTGVPGDYISTDQPSTNAHTTARAVVDATTTPKVISFDLAVQTWGAEDKMFISFTQLPTSVAQISAGSMPASDMTNAGYFDIGNARIQWGVFTGAGVYLVFPAHFRDTTYNISVTPQNPLANVTVQAAGLATAYCTFDSQNLATQAVEPTNGLHWQAIGLKP